MNSISTYIFVHDQQIILNNDITGKFKDLPDMKYVFLGMGNIDKIDNRKDVIVIRNLQYNIEQYPKFCSFTGWYGLWKNNLITTDYVNLFEYDINVSENFNQTLGYSVLEQYDFIGYKPLPMNFAFINESKYLCSILTSIQRHYNVDVNKIVNSIIKCNKNARWSSTSNATFKREIFNKYMSWFEKLIDDLKNDKMCGHAHERSISIFNIIFNTKIILTNDVIKHLMLNSHKTGLGK